MSHRHDWETWKDDLSRSDYRIIVVHRRCRTCQETRSELEAVEREAP